MAWALGLAGLPVNAVLLLAEGANRWGNGEKRQRFIESRGECGEAAAAADLIAVHGLAPEAQVASFQQRESRLAALLTGLVQRCSTTRQCARVLLQWSAPHVP